MTATTRTRAAPLWFLDNLARVHVAGEASGGAYTLVEMVGREGDMPPLHVHRREEETFFVLEGVLTLVAGGETFELGPGESVVAPRDVPHAYRVESERARWLVVCSPAGFEGFVRECAEPAKADDLPPEGRPVDGEAVARAAARFGIELLGPPGTVSS